MQAGFFITITDRWLCGWVGRGYIRIEDYPRNMHKQACLGDTFICINLAVAKSATERQVKIYEISGN